MAKQRTIIFSIILACGAFALPLLALAVEPAPAGTTELQNPLGDGATTIPVILGRVMRAGFGVLGAVALFMFMYGGFRWLTSGGNADSIKAGRDTMVWAILGIAVIFASYAIVNFVILAIAK